MTDCLSRQVPLFPLEFLRGVEADWSSPSAIGQERVHPRNRSAGRKAFEPGKGLGRLGRLFDEQLFFDGRHQPGDTPAVGGDFDGRSCSHQPEDTNSIAVQPDPTEYRDIAGEDTYVFMLLPTVLGELDALKNVHRNPDFREKVRSAIRRVKGWRTQGSLLEGVTVSGTVTVRAVSAEPDMQNTLSWLDKDVADDRLVASVLEVQAAHPNSRVVLVTGDINLMNKADLASIESAEIGS